MRLWSTLISSADFVLSKVTLTMVTVLRYKIFLMFATINIGGIAVFTLLLPETKGRSLEEMDVIFGSVSADQRKADIAKQERVYEHEANETRSERSISEQKV